MRNVGGYTSLCTTVMMTKKIGAQTHIITKMPTRFTRFGLKNLHRWKAKDAKVGIK